MKAFLEQIKTVAQKFDNVSGVVRVVSHLDADGICSAAILSKAFSRKGIKFSLSVIKRLDRSTLEGLALEPYKTFLFADLGSGCLNLIEEILGDKLVFVLDHHKLEKTKTSIELLNPNSFGEVAYEEISGAGIAYLFVRYLDYENVDLAYLVLVGAIGDLQEQKGFIGLNKLILNDAIDNNDVEIKQGLVMFGIQSRTLDKVLLYNTDPYIPGVTGDLGGVNSFLEETGIKKKGNEYPKMIDLNEDEMKRLITAIILKRLGSEEQPEDVLGPVYIMKNEEEGPTKDAREFSTLLNSCGRLNKASLGIAVCLKDKKAREEALEVLTDYRREIVKALNWFYSKKEGVIEKERYMLINAEGNIKDTIIGTLTSIVSNANLYRKKVILSMAYGLAGEIKISARGGRDLDINLRELLVGMIRKLGRFECGGHKMACGAVIPQEKEKEFIEIACNVLDNL